MFCSVYGRTCFLRDHEQLCFRVSCISLKLVTAGVLFVVGFFEWACRCLPFACFMRMMRMIVCNKMSYLLMAAPRLNGHNVKVEDAVNDTIRNRHSRSVVNFLNSECRFGILVQQLCTYVCAHQHSQQLVAKRSSGSLTSKYAYVI